METHPSRGTGDWSSSKRPKESVPQTPWSCLIYLFLAGEMPTIIQRGKILQCSAVNRQTFPKNRSSFSWGRTIPWVSHILYLIGKGMRSAGSTMRIVLSTTKGTGKNNAIKLLFFTLINPLSTGGCSSYHFIFWLLIN